MTALILCILVATAFAAEPFDDSYMHPSDHFRSRRDTYQTPNGEDTAEYWNTNAQEQLKNTLQKIAIHKRAKNIILFLGDGMSIPTLGAARVYQAQQFKKSGEESELSFEKFPFVGLSKTYCVDRQVADSACSATAYLCGVKANYGTIGVSGGVKRKDCQAMLNTTNQVNSIAHWAQQAGKSTGFVTTTRVTHASPAGTYAHIAERDWECDTDVAKDNQSTIECPDIAEQLIYGETGQNFNVIFGGGRKNFLPKEIIDEEGHNGSRSDGQNLIDVWKIQREAEGSKYKYIWNRDGLENIAEYDKVLGLFESDHCQYHLEANETTEPRLFEMATAAVEVLSKNPNGFFLFVEGGRIDHGHHDTHAKKALDETVEFSIAIDEIRRMTNPEETLIVVTSDHAHTMSYSGYADRGNDIFGFAGISDVDKKPYSTLSYANGPGYKHPMTDGDRYDITNDPMGTNNYQFPAVAPLYSEAHGGDDVAIFALGPQGHLVVAVHEQNIIPHIMAYASCIGNGLTFCDNYKYKF